MSDIGFTATHLRDIADLMDHLDHEAPIPRPDGKRLPVTVTLDAADRVKAETACTIRLYPDLDALAYFDGDGLASNRRVLASNRRVLEHEATTPPRGHDPDGACCRAAATGGDA